jgi:hypothetical protein
MNATMYGCEIVWPSSIGSGESWYAPSENGLFDHFITKASEILFFEMQIHRLGPRSSCHDATE